MRRLRHAIGCLMIDLAVDLGAIAVKLLASGAELMGTTQRDALYPERRE